MPHALLDHLGDQDVWRLAFVLPGLLLTGEGRMRAYFDESW